MHRGAKILLTNVNWVIKPQQKIGLVGKNGSGKSSLFATLLGELAPETGNLELASHVKLAHLAQEIKALPQKAIDYVLDGDQTLRQLQQAISIAEQKQQGHQLAELHEKMQDIDGYSAQARASSILKGLGFSHAQQQETVAALSGGWRMRLNLARVLFTPADLLLLDEPTNHLDLDALLWLENHIKRFKGTLILISHDRDFLDNVVTHIAHIEHKNLKIYTGSFSEFEKQLCQMLALQKAQYIKQQQLRDHMQSFIDRFRYKSSKAKQAQSRIKALERMSLVAAVHVDSAFNFKFAEPEKLPNPLLRLEDVSVGYADQIIIKNIGFSLQPKQRIGIIGPNGAGKSTFIKLLSKQLEPIQGDLEIAKDLNIGYFTQHQIEHLKLNQSPLQHLQVLTSTLSEQEGRNFLGGFGFSHTMALSPITYFSGGEKARLALALLVWQKPNLLLLDEPTNHFDLEMRTALTFALQDFKGALLIISHDRHLLRATTDELYLVYQQQLKVFDGSIDDYAQWLQKTKDTTKGTAKVVVPKKNRKQTRIEQNKQRQQLKPLLRSIKQTETKISDIQQLLKTIDVDLQKPDLYATENKNSLQDLLQSQGQLRKQLEQLEKEWVSLQAKME